MKYRENWEGLWNHCIYTGRGYFEGNNL